MKQYLNKKIRSEMFFSILALFSISSFLLIQNSDKKIQNIAYAIETSTTTTAMCTDSDNGADYFIKGRIYNPTINNGTFDSYDKCSETNAGQLLEYICKNDAWYATYYQCPNGCKEGACIKNDDDVLIKDFSVTSVGDAWKASGHIQKSSGNSAVIWASLDGGTAKQIGSQIATDGSFYFTPSNYWTLSAGKHTIKLDVKPTLTDPTLPNTAETIFTIGSPVVSDDVLIKDFSVTSVGDVWKASGHIQKSSGNSAVIWASLDGGTAKQIGSQIATDGSFYFTPSNYWTLSAGKHAIKLEVKPTLTDPTLPNTAEASFTIGTKENSYSLPNNTIVKVPGENGFYALIDGKKISITNISDLAKYGYSLSEINKLAKEYGISTTSNNSGAKQEIVGDATTGRIYKIINGRRVWVPTVAAFNAQGLKWEEVRNQIDSDLISYAETRLVKDAKGNIYFITNNGKKKSIINTEVFNSYGNKTEDIVEVSDEFLNSIETVKLVKENGSNKIYMITGNKKQWVKNIQAFIRLKLKWEDIDTVNATEINAYTEGSIIE
jgi:hypothetical protein